MSANQQYPSAPEPGRPRTKSNFSFHSNHSRKSSGSVTKIDLHETHLEKEKRRLTTKADPSVALSEAEPSMVARGEKSQLASIRAIQHRDAQGNPIVDPDRSNPTRSRWERPLDTIRSFEAAIDGSYSRKSYIRSDSDGPTSVNRRSSYYPPGNQDERARYSQNGYPGRNQPYRPDNYAQDGRPNNMTRPDSYYQPIENSAGPSNGYYPNRARYPRTASEPHFGNAQGVYPISGNQQSYETVTTASGSGNSGDPVGYATDPSSENSSLDRVAPLPVPAKELGENYGFTGFGGNPQIAPLPTQYSPSDSPAPQQQQGNGYRNQGPPQVPRKDVFNRVPIKLGASSGNTGPPVENKRPVATEKRKSWFGKRFSRS